jgi:hypothetical protein
MWDIRKSVNREPWFERLVDDARRGDVDEHIRKLDAGFVLAMLGRPLATQSVGQCPGYFRYRSELWRDNLISQARRTKND